MGSEEQVLELMVLIDEGLQEACKVEDKLEEYDQRLQVSCSLNLIIIHCMGGHGIFCNAP